MKIEYCTSPCLRVPRKIGIGLTRPNKALEGMQGTNKLFTVRLLVTDRRRCYTLIVWNLLFRCRLKNCQMAYFWPLLTNYPALSLKSERWLKHLKLRVMSLGSCWRRGVRGTAFRTFRLQQSARLHHRCCGVRNGSACRVRLQKHCSGRYPCSCSLWFTIW